MASFRPPVTHTTGRGFVHAFTAPFASMSASLSHARRRLPASLNTLWLSGALLIGGLALGALISTEWQSRAAGSVSASSPVTRQADREMVAATISRLEDEQANLKQQITNLRTQLNSVQGTDAQHKSTLSDINSEIAQQRDASGLAALQGQGVVVTLDDSTVNSIPENEDPANYILHEYDLRDVLNTLWIAGAEAASVNGERVVGSTSVYCVGTTIIVNSTRLSPPYEVRAIGDPHALAAAIQGSPQLEKFNQRATIYDLPVKIEQKQDVQVPAYNGSFVFKYATIQGQK